MAENSKDDTNKKPAHVAINSIQRAVFVDRICIDYYYDLEDVYNYDIDNLYPNKCISIAKRSGSLSTALDTLQRFLKGKGFEDESLNTLIVNEKKGLDGFELLKIISGEKARLGFAIWCGYNRFGQIASLKPINFEDIRVKSDNSGYIITDWTRKITNSLQPVEEFEVNNFDPENALNEINEIGFEEYTGQLFYWKGTNEIYPLASFDSVLDDAQFDAESKLYSLSNIQNNFSLDGAFIYPGNLDNNKEFEAVKEKIEDNGTGAVNAGRILTIGVPPKLDLANWKYFQSFSRNNIDAMFKDQRTEAKLNIYEKYQQPEALNGRSSKGMFNQQSLNDAFEFYNGITEGERMEIEKALNKIFAFSIWDNFTEIKINPLDFGGDENEKVEETETAQE